MAAFIAVLLFLLLAGTVSAFGYVHYVKPTRLLDQLTNNHSGIIPSSIAEQKKSKSLAGRLLEPIGSFLPVSPQDAGAAKRELSAAGFRSGTAVPVYYGCKLVLLVLFFAIALSVRSHFDGPVLRLVSLIGGAVGGYCFPSFILGRLVKRRCEQIRFALPDVLDLLVVCSEAGCGLDQGIVNVSRELKTVHPAVSEELSFVNMEIMAGKSRADSLRNFARRTGEEEVKKLMAILIQTDRFGTSISEALRTQSDYLRIRRRQEAEERAGKVGVKLVFPIFFFCLPSLLVVTAGPGMLQLFQNLGAMSTGMR